MRAKVTIVGAGMTGGTMAQRLAETGYVDVVLQDIVEGLPQGKSLDLAESAPHVGFNARLTGSNGWDDTKGSDVVVITSGLPRKPGMTREELLNINAGIVRDVATAAAKASPKAVFIIFANPMDAMCHVTLEATGLPKERVIGQGGMLDSARYRTFLAWAAGCSVQDVHASVLGGHTEATMVPDRQHVHDRRRATDHGAATRRDRRLRPARQERRRGDRLAAQDRLGVLRAGRRHHRDGRGGAARQEARDPLRRLHAGRVRDQGHVRRAAGQGRRRLASSRRTSRRSGKTRSRASAPPPRRRKS